MILKCLKWFIEKIAKKCYDKNDMDGTTAIITTTITAIATTFVALSNIYMNSQRKKDRDEAKRIAKMNAAKSSIQNMITQDIIWTEVLGKMPNNRDKIDNEYKSYVKSGGNGTVARQYEEYCEWFDKQEKKLTKK